MGLDVWTYLKCGKRSWLRKHCTVRKRQKETSSEEREIGQVVFLDNEGEGDRQRGRVEEDHRRHRRRPWSCPSPLFLPPRLQPLTLYLPFCLCCFVTEFSFLFAEPFSNILLYLTLLLLHFILLLNLAQTPGTPGSDKNGRPREGCGCAQTCHQFARFTCLICQTVHKVSGYIR